ncbi:phage tail tape measure protein [Deinococcus sp. HMF7620]|uniref:Phage tail tape measure protein n=1 Tax=Deinococcus arboris TaxID=2682977 RepID=A0A7C9HR94_9DEIO|nr:phage tail tape measure protein [Deinococcus arboris]MVN86812.1 phage tail tape measure protein [Deinococcus arboris]
MTQTSLGDLVLTPVLDMTDVHTQLAKYRQFVERETGVKITVDARESLNSLDRVKRDLAQMGDLNRQQTAQQTQNARLLGAQYQASMRALQEQNAAVIAAHRAQTAAGRAEAAAAAERTARIREQQAQLRLTAQLATQAARDEKQRSMASVNALSNEMVSYRNMYKARQIGEAELLEAQRRIHSQALLQAQAVDKTTDAYRRLTEVAAGAQRSIDRAEGVNPRGGLAEGVSMGLQSALGQFGVAGDLLGGFVQYIAAKRAAAVNTAETLGSDTMEGLIRGMKSDQAQVKDTAGKAADGIEAAVRERLDIHSPSRVMEYLGRMVGDGFVSGIRSRWDDAKRAANGLSDAARSGIATNLGSGTVTGNLGGMLLGGAAGGILESGKISNTSQALDGLNKQLEQNAAASAAAATAGAATEVATEALGGAVEGAAEHVQSFTDARREQDAVQREAAINDAKTALAFTAVAAAATAAAVALAVNFNAAADYEAAMLKAQATTEATTAQMQQLNDVARSNRLANLGIDGIQAAKGIEELGSQGLNTAQIIDGGLVNSMTLAKAVNTDVATAAGVAASSTKAFGLEAKELARVGDVVTNAVNGTSVKIDNFSDAIGAGGAVAKSAGVEFVEFTAAISFMTDKAIGASDAGTSLKSFLQALTPNSAAAKVEMQKLGFSAFTADGQFKGLGQMIEELRAAFLKLSPEQRAVTSELIFGSDGIRAFNILVEQGSAGLERRIDMLDRTGKMTDAANKKLEGVRGEQERFNAALKNFQIQAGEAFLPAGAKMLEWSGNFLKDLVAINREYGNLFKGKASFGAETLDLPTWLKQTGLRESDLTQAELEKVKLNLQLMQNTVNLAAKNATQYRTLGLEGMAQGVEQQALKVLGTLGATLGKIQAAASQRPRAIGPEQGGTGSASGVPDGAALVSGKTLVTLLGMGGRKVLNEYGVSGADYHHDGAVSANATHNGIDYAAPRGAPIIAPFTGLLTVREDAKNGKVFELVDALGQKLLGIHLDSFDKGVLEALEAGGGKAIIQAGQKIGGVGNTGTTAGKTPHLHLMGYDRSGNVVSPTLLQYQSKTEEGYYQGSGYGRDAPTVPEKGFDAYIKEAQRLTAAVEKYAPRGAAPDAEKWKAANETLKKFRESNDLAAQALEWVSLETGKSEKAVSQYGQTFDRLKGQLDITQAFKDKGGSTADYLKNLDAIAKAAEAAANAERDRNGVTSEKYKQLLSLSADAAKKAQGERDRQNREQDAADREAEQRRNEAQQRAAKINEALRQGRIEAARLELGRLDTMRENDLRAAGDNAQKVAQVELRYAELTYQARKAIAEKERQDRDAEIKNNTGLNDAARKLALSNSKKVYDNAILSADSALRAAQSKIAADLTQLSIETGGAFAVAFATGLKDALELDEQVTAAAIKNSAPIPLDLSELRDRSLAVLDIQRQGNEALAEEALDFADQLTKKEDYSGALGVLEAALEAVFTAAQGGEDAGEAINKLTVAIEKLNATRREALDLQRQENALQMAGESPLNPNPARNPGPITGPAMEGTPVAARGTRAPEPATPDPGVAARDPGAAERAERWEATLRAERVDEYRASLELLTLAELNEAKARAIQGQDSERYGLILAEITRQTEANRVAIEAAAQAAVDLYRNPDEDRLESWNARLTDLVESYEAGGMTAVQFGEQVQELAPELDRLADAAERQGQTDLAQIYRDAAAGLRAMTPEVSKTLASLNKVSEYAGYVRDLSSALSGLASSTGNDDLAANLDGAANAASRIGDMAVDVAKLVASSGADIGAWVSLSVKLIGSVSDALNGFRQAYEKADKMREDFNKRFTLIRGDDFAKTFVRSRGWLADTFGGGPEVRQELDEFGLKIAQAIEGGVLGASRTA